MFYPNKIKKDDVGSLEPWQLLVAVCHFGPKMGDCVEMNYGYKMKAGELFCGDISLRDDIDIDEPVRSMENYAGFNWEEWCRSALRGMLSE